MHSGIWTVPEVNVHVFNNEKKKKEKKKLLSVLRTPGKEIQFSICTTWWLRNVSEATVDVHNP